MAMLPDKPATTQGKMRSRFVDNGKILEDPFKDRVLPSWKLKERADAAALKEKLKGPAAASSAPGQDKTKHHHEHHKAHKAHKAHKTKKAVAETPAHTMNPARGLASPLGQASAALEFTGATSDFFDDGGFDGYYSKANQRDRAKMQRSARKIQRWYMRRSHRMRARRMVFQKRTFTSR